VLQSAVVTKIDRECYTALHSDFHPSTEVKSMVPAVHFQTKYIITFTN